MHFTSLVLGIAGSISAASASAATLREARSNFAACADASGVIYAVGGSESGSIERFEPTRAEAGWAKVATMTEARLEHAAAIYKGLLYVFGGRTRDGRVERMRDDIAVHDFQTHGWRTVGTLTKARRSLAAVATADGMLVLGGDNAVYQNPAPAVIGDDGLIGMNLVEFFSPDRAGTETLPAMSARRRNHSAVLGKDGRVFVIGGDQTGMFPGNLFPSPAYVIATEAYDAKKGEWSQLAPIPSRRTEMAVAAAADGKIYAIGGYNIRKGGPIATVEAFDPAANTWSKVADLPKPRFRAAAVESQGRIYVLGGLDENWEASDSVQVFDPAKGSWE